MRIVSSVSIALVLVVYGCTPARYRGADEHEVAHGSPDPSASPPVDAGTSMYPDDAWSMPGHDASITFPDAWVGASDAWVAPQPDASTGSCPTYTTNVQPIYRQHCANCHTTGGDPHFGSSYTVANRSSSSCGTSEAACTIELGRPGGSMAYRDPYGGFSTSEIATIQSWIDCGRPM